MQTALDVNAVPYSLFSLYQMVLYGSIWLFNSFEWTTNVHYLLSIIIIYYNFSNFIYKRKLFFAYVTNSHGDGYLLKCFVMSSVSYSVSLVPISYFCLIFIYHSIS